MTREWKPGDLLVGEFGTQFLVVEVTANSRAAWGEGLHAVRDDGNGYAVGAIRGARPLAVIDPENREQIRSLFDLWLAQPLSDGTNRLQAALRAYADPKPIRSAVVSAALVEDMLRQVAADRESSYWADGHTEILDATETYLRSLDDFLGGGGDV